MLLNFEHLKTFYSALKQKMKNFRGNWNQNDPAADDYIKNRPFYEELGFVEIVSNLTSEEYNNGNHPECNFVPGSRYKVILNGKVYDNLICYESGGYNVIGGNGYPFYIDDDGGNNLYIEHRGDNDNFVVSIYIYGTVIHKLDKKFIDIPDNLVTTENLDEMLSGLDETLTNIEETLTAVVGPYSNGLAYSLVNGKYEVTGIGTCTDTDIIIPSIVDGYRVTGIGSRSFYDCANLTSISIPDSVTGIGERAFYNCTSLTSITIPEGVTSINNYLFYGCTSLTSIMIPDSVTSIGDYAFYGCTSLTNITIPNSVTKIFSSAFNGCTNLKYITIPNSVTKIFNSTFRDCTSLTDITIPNSVTNIGNSAFHSCTNLKHITIPNSVTNIDAYAFKDCSNLTIYCEAKSEPQDWNLNWNTSNCPVVWGIPLDFIGVNNALINYPSISIDEIDKACTQMRAGLYATGAIDSYTKYGQEGIVDQLVTPWEELLGNQIIVSSSGKLTTNSTVTELAGDLVIPDDGSVLRIDTTATRAAFRDCTRLTGVLVPSSVTQISTSTFAGCSSLKSIMLPFVGTSASTASTYHFGAIFGASSSSDQNTYIPASLENVVITDAAVIKSGAFNGCTNLKHITIPDSVTSIESSTFSGCAGLINITIPNNVTSIGSYAFYNCGSLASITIPDSVTELGQSAFCGCASLTNVTIPDSVTRIGINGFRNCTSLTSITIPYGITSIENQTFSDCTSLTNIIIPDSITSITYMSFYRCSSLTEITFEGTVEQWNAITFGTGWNYNVPATYVQCTDGQVSLT